MLHIGNIEADEFGTPKSTCKSYQQQSLIAPVFRAASHLGCEIAPNSDPEYRSAQVSDLVALSEIIEGSR